MHLFQKYNLFKIDVHNPQNILGRADRIDRYEDIDYIRCIKLTKLHVVDGALKIKSNPTGDAIFNSDEFYQHNTGKRVEQIHSWDTVHREFVLNDTAEKTRLLQDIKAKQNQEETKKKNAEDKQSKINELKLNMFDVLDTPTVKTGIDILLKHVEDGDVYLDFATRKKLKSRSQELESISSQIQTLLRVVDGGKKKKRSKSR
jgi:hypothetical protein